MDWTFSMVLLLMIALRGEGRERERTRVRASPVMNGALGVWVVVAVTASWLARAFPAQQVSGGAFVLSSANTLSISFQPTSKSKEWPTSGGVSLR